MQKPMLTKDEQHNEYKYGEYIRIGFTEHQARKLTEQRHVSVGAVRELIGKGCAVNTAYRIYRP